MEDQEILEMAIHGEIESYEFYERVAEVLEDVRKNAVALAKEERKHKEMLETAYSKKYGNFVRKDNFYVYPELKPDASLFSSNPNRREILSIAISAEQKARDFYERSYEETHESMFSKLAEMEEGHREKIQRWYLSHYPLE